jgi:hypothetical protein
MEVDDPVSNSEAQTEGAGGDNSLPRPNFISSNGIHFIDLVLSQL